MTVYKLLCLLLPNESTGCITGSVFLCNYIVWFYYVLTLCFLCRFLINIMCFADIHSLLFEKS